MKNNKKEEQKKNPDQFSDFGIFDLAGEKEAAVLKRLRSGEKGLTENEARARLERYGANVLAAEKKFSLAKEFFSKFKSPLIILLIAAAAISAYFGESVNAAIIGVMVLLSAVLDFWEEHHAGQAAKKLLESVKTTAMVRRNGKDREIRTAQICLGDILVLNSGDLVPADARLIKTKDFHVNQSALTGESEPREKNSFSLSGKKESLIDLDNIVFAGTNVVSGSALAVVLKTGANTEFGKISSALTQTSEKSEFEIGITNFGFLIMKSMLFLVLFIFLFNAVLKHQILDSFLFAIAIAVGITPELLPVIMSVTMARGSIRMAKKGAIVKKLSAIPSFGSMDVLCTDKTGTLTEGKISLVKYINIFGQDSEEVLRLAFLNSFFQTGIENPLDEAVLDFKHIKTAGIIKVDEIPFDFVRKRLSVVVEEGGEKKLITKGAPEEIFSCAKFFCQGALEPFSEMTEEAKNSALKIYDQLSAEGYRVLALAIKKVNGDKKVFSKEDEADLALCGFIGFLDPPKKGTRKALDRLEAMGIEMKIITGDNELVARKICSEIGVKIKGVILGKDVHGLTDDALRRRVERTTIFARFSPDEKSRVIMALKSNKHIVGYMGDGINDAPSLKMADVGVSVNNAVDVAKESADIILINKSLDILSDGVIEGRKVFGNTMKYIMMGLSSNFGNMFSAAGSVVFLPFFPMLPIQILLNNFIYDVSQITIPADNVDDEWIKKARRWNMPFIRRFMLVFGSISSFYDFLTFFVLYYGFRLVNGNFQTGWFLESLATQTLVIHIIRTKKFPFVQSRASRPLLWSTFGAVFLAWLIPFSPLAEFFGLQKLPLYVLAVLAAIVVCYLLTVEVVKRFFYRRQDL